MLKISPKISRFPRDVEPTRYDDFPSLFERLSSVGGAWNNLSLNDLCHKDYNKLNIFIHCRNREVCSEMYWLNQLLETNALNSGVVTMDCSKNFSSQIEYRFTGESRNYLTIRNYMNHQYLCGIFTPRRTSRMVLFSPIILVYKKKHVSKSGQTSGRNIVQYSAVFNTTKNSLFMRNKFILFGVVFLITYLHPQNPKQSISYFWGTGNIVYKIFHYFFVDFMKYRL